MRQKVSLFLMIGFLPPLAWAKTDLKELICDRLNQTSITQEGNVQSALKKQYEVCQSHYEKKYKNKSPQVYNRKLKQLKTALLGKLDELSGLSQFVQTSEVKDCDNNIVKSQTADLSDVVGDFRMQNVDIKGERYNDMKYAYDKHFKNVGRIFLKKDGKWVSIGNVTYEVLENGRVRVVTNKHMFYNKDGSKKYDTSSEFEVRFNFDSSRSDNSYKINSFCNVGNRNFDECEVGLDKPVVGVEPVLRIFPTAEEMNQWVKGDLRVFLVSYHLGLKDDLYETKQGSVRADALRWMQECRIEGFKKAGVNSEFYHTCDTEGGSSGGSMMAFINGQVVKIGTNVGTYKMKKQNIAVNIMPNDLVGSERPTLTYK